MNHHINLSIICKCITIYIYIYYNTKILSKIEFIIDFVIFDRNDLKKFHIFITWKDDQTNQG